ncbi:MptD family putative ECF transporter S component [Candidatus Contubernalis alkaliaceticus]|uniref:MptD family putative ECF transporter S component n=1 Tax=Candidatus Contubernalis alkaliaceticus TaxID=338645 RepID=UPI001F4BF46D|nr:MptD family putative ECF transporter S component [Candidatus Contubernalis alkalaceticus]UNC93101.1 MptD family putative ECF transporter S component [Candidatus Contubernalis alkalaceticus]
MIFLTDRYMQVMVAKEGGVYLEWFQNVLAYLNTGVFMGIVVISAMGAVLGALLGRKLLAKHFIKAGIVQPN